MSNQLSIDEQGKSQEALLHYKRNAGDIPIFRSDVKVYDKKGNLMFDFSDLATTIMFESNKVTINIMWEDAGLERDSFRNQKLYGVYYASYTKMRYKNGVLTIQGDRKIVMNYSKEY
ncbi:hypothetical protein C2I18_14285 [Paenibacillus sp. PK3_47]|uniref:hypothetical protein n=1 Tax=Paenibacillus sp. PK3_47 TaxID=2072642 RepID=UPI00201D6417|nr:hypothetical protein [Paenibacillus sp. PK3_47]UQZ34587.1 hypothetical protein C2I18_14285 [Paenibacillus sp. PK3_47]